MTAKRKYPTAEEKALILKRYLVEKVPMSDLCDEYGLQPSPDLSLAARRKTGHDVHQQRLQRVGTCRAPASRNPALAP